jgi:putative MATE family efflux protein
MFIANACLRGAGDTLTPAMSMVVVDIVNIALSFGLTYGWWGLPEMGFRGIAMGTLIAYTSGGLLQFFVLVRGRGGIRLYLHRMKPHWHNLKRLLRIGVPSAIEGLIHWAANFALLIVINHMDPTNISAAAHANAIRIESISYMAGFAVATAAATMVGQSLGMRSARRATRSGYLAYALGGGIMTLCGIMFVFFAHVPAAMMSDHPEVIHLTTWCLIVTGFIQFAFAAAAVFGGALRGAGDTMAVMLINMTSVIAVRFAGVLIVGLWLDLGLVWIWVVLSGELLIRGLLMYGRWVHGGWRRIQV